MKNRYTRNKSALKSDMNVVPYIDVMLVLLVIFMVTAPMLTTGVEVNLPSEKTSNIAKNELTPVIVSLQKNGQLFISYEHAIDKKVSEQELADILSELSRQHSNENGNQVQVMINADKDNQYSKIMHLMAIIQKTGIVKVGLLSEGQTPPKK
ncbi:MAG: protein TolR [Moraxella sp.]|nr:MAG: protein TolR [Moraxella sp.]